MESHGPVPKEHLIGLPCFCFRILLLPMLSRAAHHPASIYRVLICMLSPAQGLKPSIIFHRQVKVRVASTPLIRAAWDIFNVTEVLHQVPEFVRHLQWARLQVGGWRHKDVKHTMCMYVPDASTLGRLRQENSKVRASLGYIMRACLRTCTKHLTAGSTTRNW